MSSISRPNTFASLDRRKIEFRFDGYLVAATIYLLSFGLMSLYSKSMSFDHGGVFRKQLLNIGIGLVPFFLMLLVHPRFWEQKARAVYVVNLILLIGVKFMGKTVNGAERWIEIGPLQFQPSELAKLLVILTLASFFASRQDSIHRASTFALSFVHVLAPMLLIIWQPHLGATLVIFVMWFAVSLVARVPLVYLATAAAVLVVGVGLALTMPAIAGHFLHGYQKDRIAGLQSQDKDVRGRNWQTDRAEIAFGVGGVYGTGYLKGQQKEGGFIPEQHTDFIFSVVGEEEGLVGCTLLLLGYAFFFYRIWLIMLHADEPYYQMVAGGVFTVLLFHAFVNMAMVLQLLPVVGLWLPFMSYGGTAVWLCLASVGLLLNIRRRERPILF